MKHLSILLTTLLLSTLLFGCQSNKNNTSKDIAQYQCPMKCEGDKTYEEAGTCPVCKMDLKEINTENNISKDIAQYQCPMKCEGDKTYEEAGTCPVCKMDLKEIDIEK